MRLIITGGGTAGHVYPAIAIAKELKRRRTARVLFVGSKSGLEGKIIKEEGFPFQPIAAKPLPKTFSLKSLLIIVSLSSSFLQAFWVLKKFKPDAVLGTGGYVSFPVVFMAHLLGIPSIIHEENLLPGRANKMLSKYVDKITVSYVDSKYFLPENKVIVTGNPIRSEILGLNRDKGRQALGLNPGEFTILIFGGSWGAQSINQAVLGALPSLNSKNLQIVHITGEKNYQAIKEQIAQMTIPKGRGYKILPYLANMADALAAADLVVSRAGASTCAELTVAGLPAILIPYPHAISNHQFYNARFLAQKGAAEILSEHELSGKKLAQKILELIEDKDKLKGMAKISKSLGRIDAAAKILDTINSIM